MNGVMSDVEMLQRGAVFSDGSSCSEGCVCLAAVTRCPASVCAARAGQACTVTRRVLLGCMARHVRRSAAVRTEPTATV